MTEVQDLAAPEFNITNGELPGNGLAPTNFYPQQSGDPKPSFPPSAPTQLVVAKAGHKKQARSDSDLSDIAEEDAGSDFEGEDSADSQDSFTRSLLYLDVAALNIRIQLVQLLKLYSSSA